MENKAKWTGLKQWAPYIILVINIIFFAGMLFSEGKASAIDIDDLKDFKKTYQTKIDVMANDISHIRETLELMMKQLDKQDDRLNNLNNK